MSCIRTPWVSPSLNKNRIDRIGQVPILLVIGRQNTYLSHITDHDIAPQASVTERPIILPPAIEGRQPMFAVKNVQYFMGKAKRCFGLAKTQREGAKIQREGADKLEALGHELEAKADEIETKIQKDKRQ
jgi:hypothetical protein